jgi:hypothetical protein
MKISTIVTQIFLLSLFIFIVSCKKTPVTTVSFKELNLQPEMGNDVSVFYYRDSLGADSFHIADQNFYGDSILYINAYTSPQHITGANALIRFDALSALPANADILVAKLYLYGTDSSYIPANIYGNTVEGGGNSFHPGLSDSAALVLYNTHADTAFENTLLFQKITSSWDAHTVTYNTQPSVSDSAIISASSSQWNFNVAIDVTGIVKDWFINPATNFGCELSIAHYNYFPAPVWINHQMVFNSSAAVNAVLKPQLIIVYQ